MIERYDLPTIICAGYFVKFQIATYKAIAGKIVRPLLQGPTNAFVITEGQHNQARVWFLDCRISLLWYWILPGCFLLGVTNTFWVFSSVVLNYAGYFLEDIGLLRWWFFGFSFGLLRVVDFKTGTLFCH